MSGARVLLLGRLVQEPELSFTPTGEAVASFRLGASSSTLMAESSSGQHHCLAWNQGGRRLADLVVDSLHVGDIVYVEGRVQAPPGQRAQRPGPRAPTVLVQDVQLLQRR